MKQGLSSGELVKMTAAKRRKLLREAMLIKLVRKEGQSLIEILIGLALIALGIGAATILVFGGEKLLIDRQNAVQAKNLAGEGLEAVYSIRERGWNDLSDGEHGLQFQNGEWQFSGTSDTDGLFVRKIIITTESENVKKVESKVSWETEKGRKQKVLLVTLLTNWENVVPPPDPGDAGGGGISGDWQNPRTLGSVDLGPGNSATDLDVINKIIYMSAEASAAAKPDFFIIDATNGQSPFIISSLNTGPSLNAVDATQNYAYVANRDINAQLQVININNLSNPSLVASFKLPGVSGKEAVGSSIFYANSKVYVGTKKAAGPEFHIIDVSNPNSPSSLGSFEINADVNAIYVSNNIAYLANSADAELKILDVSDPANIVEVGHYDAPGESEDGKSLHLVGNKIYLGRLLGKSHVTHHELHVVDVKNSSTPQNLGSKDIASDVNDLKVRDSLAFLGTADANKEFQVWNISDPANITFWSSFNFPQLITGIDYEDNLVYVAVRSNDALRIITSSP